MFELVLEFILQVLFELILELGWESLAQAFGGRRYKLFPLACIGWMMVGAACGGLSAWIFPYKVLRWSGPRGVSLFLSPLLCGAVMKAIGDRRREMGRPTTALATFWGGCLFAFGFAVARFLLLG